MSVEVFWNELMEEWKEERLQKNMGKDLFLQNDCESCPYFSPDGSCSIDGWLKNEC